MGWFKRAGKGVAVGTGAAKERRARRWQSCLFLAGVLLLPGLVILGGVVSAIYGMTVQWELDALEASIRAKGEPVTEEELDLYERRMLETNPKAQKYLQPLALLSAIPEKDPMERFYPLSIGNYAGRGSFPDYYLHPACEYLEDRRHVLDALEEAEGVALSVEADWDPIPYRALRQFEELIWTKGFMALHDRDWEAFFDAQEQLLEFSEAFLVVSPRVPAIRHGMDLLALAIKTGEVPTTFYGRISAQYGLVDTQKLLQWRLIHYRVVIGNGLREYFSGEETESYVEANAPLRTWVYRRIGGIPGYRSLTGEDVARHVRFYTAVLEDHGKPWRKRYLKSILRQPFMELYSMEGDRALPLRSRVVNGIGRVLYGQTDLTWWVRRSLASDGRLALDPLSLEDAYELFLVPELHDGGHPIFEVGDPTVDYIKIEFRLRSLRLAMLIDAYRQYTGGFPDSLDALDAAAVAAIGGDPFGDGPLGYREVEDGFLLYSVGPDLKDDGGEYLGMDQGDLVEQFVKEKPVEPNIEKVGRRGRDVQPAGPPLTLGPLKPKAVAE